MALLDVDRVGDRGGDGQGDSGADLECRVEHSATETFDVDWDGGQDEGTGGYENQGYGGDADEGCGEDVDPAVSKLAYFFSY